MDETRDNVKMVSRPGPFRRTTARVVGFLHRHCASSSAGLGKQLDIRLAGLPPPPPPTYPTSKVGKLKPFDSRDALKTWRYVRDVLSVTWFASRETPRRLVL